MNANIPTGKRDITPPSVFDAVIVWIPTVRTRESSVEKGNVRLLGINLEASYPPSVKLPSTFFSRYGAPAV